MQGAAKVPIEQADLRIQFQRAAEAQAACRGVKCGVGSGSDCFS